MKVTEDLRLAEKRKAMMSVGGRRSPSPPPKSSRSEPTGHHAKPLPYIPSSKPGANRPDGSRIDETEL
jgi:hypothetical protein